MLDFFTIQTITTSPRLLVALYSVSLALLLSIAIGITYEKTFRGLSYSRNYIQSLILSSIVAATIMQAIGDSLARGLGMIGALAIIRFRTNFKDSRDIIFMFAALAAGISCGVGSYSSGIVGTVFFCGTAVILYFSKFGQNRYFDGLLRFNLPSESHEKEEIDKILNHYCRVFALVTLRETVQGERLDYAYHVKLRKNKSNSELMDAFKKIQGITAVSLMLQETTVEL